jgi:hypothetical protein
MRHLAIALLPLALFAAGCSSSDSTPSTPTAHAVQTFNGTLQPLGTDMYSFTTTITGVVTVTLTNAGPPAGLTLGLGIGTPNGSACTLIQSQQVQPANIAQISGTADPGSFCVTVFDPGTLTAPANYTVVVSHF